MHTPKPYYVYYDGKTKGILSILSEKVDMYENAIEVTYEDIEKFLTGEWHIKDFKVDYLDYSSNLSIIGNDDRGFDFKNSEFAIIDKTDDYAEFIVEWNLKKKTWTFKLDNSFRKTYNGMFNSKMPFFITLESDLDFLIRTIEIDAVDLKNKKGTVVPFEYDIELDINKISMASKMNFKNYALRIVNE
jgi:hypothetical protein